MSCKTLYPNLIRKGKGTGFDATMLKLRALENTHPNLTVGEMADALARTTTKDIEEAVKEKAATDAR